MKRDNFIKLIKDNFQENEQILFCVPEGNIRNITSESRIKVMSIEKYNEKQHRFIEEEKKVISLIL